MRGLGFVITCVLASTATAQPNPERCEPCDRGDALIGRFALDTVRTHGPLLASLTLSNPLPSEQYARIVDLRAQTPVLGRLGALDDIELSQIAAALCRDADAQCSVVTLRSLTCLAERCEVDLPDPDPKRADVGKPLPECRHLTRKRSTPIGLGLDWGTGWDRSDLPNDGRTWSLGIAARLALRRRYGLVVRADHFAGRDAATDMNGDGTDDEATGSVTRFSALAGPSFVLDATGFEKWTRSVRLDVLGGVLATSSQPGEDGVAAGFDLGLQLAGFRTGVRVIQGFGDASGATLAVVHVGAAVGSVPPFTDLERCSDDARSTRLALGFELPIGGIGIASPLGYLATGFGIELWWHVSRRFDIGTHADILLYPGNNRERTIAQAALAGVRIDHGEKAGPRKRTGLFSTVMAGYQHAAMLTPTTAGSGPIADLSLGWGVQDSEIAGHVRLHARLGVSPDNFDYRAVFVSLGFELRFDPRRWNDRNHDY
ncbi:MAG: hypothetical protein H0V17_36530 [Deltaproteobacteria bacterium]|nr:hypothetical protein [Deltaproteobacteria bacterium]